MRSVIEFADKNSYPGAGTVVIHDEEWADILNLNKTMTECIAEIKQESER